MLFSKTLCIWLSIGSLAVVFAQANELPKTLYDQGKYQEALDSLQQSGLKTAADHYNAANSYFKLGKPGQALAHYQKAQSLAPGDPDIQYNLNLTKELLEKNNALTKDRAFWSGTLSPFLRCIPEVAIESIAVVLGFLIFAMALRARKNSIKPGDFFSGFKFLTLFSVWILTLGLLGAIFLEHSTSRATVLADTAAARSGPAQSFTELFKITAGTVVETTGESRNGWLQVRFSLGNVGWIMEKDLLPL